MARWKKKGFWIDEGEGQGWGGYALFFFLLALACGVGGGSEFFWEILLLTSCSVASTAFALAEPGGPVRRIAARAARPRRRTGGSSGFARLAEVERELGVAPVAPGTVVEDPGVGIVFLPTETPIAPPSPLEPGDMEVLPGREVEGEVLCPYCGDVLALDRAVRCAECRSPHHPDCWKAGGTCTTFGCGSRTAVRGSG